MKAQFTVSLFEGKWKRVGFFRHEILTKDKKETNLPESDETYQNGKQKQEGIT